MQTFPGHAALGYDLVITSALGCTWGALNTKGTEHKEREMLKADRYFVVKLHSVEPDTVNYAIYDRRSRGPNLSDPRYGCMQLTCGLSKQRADYLCSKFNTYEKGGRG